MRIKQKQEDERKEKKEDVGHQNKLTHVSPQIVMFVALSSLTYGYAFSVFSTSIGQVGFYEYFDLSTTGPRAGYTNSMLGAINALFSAGAAFGALSIAWLPDWMGRKKTIQLAALISLVGGVRCPLPAPSLTYTYKLLFSGPCCWLCHRSYAGRRAPDPGHRCRPVHHHHARLPV